MKLKKTLLAVGLILACSLATMAQSTDNTGQQMRQAAIDAYNEWLQEHPDDVAALFGRANQYYFNGDYNKALDDVDKAIENTSEKEKDMRFDEFMLRAKIYDYRNNLEAELADLKAASAINPTSLSCIDMLAKVSYKLKDYDSAEKNFNSILRVESMNYDALYGLAKVEVMRGNFEKAAEYVDKAVSLFSTVPQVYINRADVLNMMQQYEPAAQDLISALSVGTDNAQALEDLVAMSDQHYDAVMKALGQSIDKAPRVGMFYYVRSQIAMKHQHFTSALCDLNSIIDNNLYNYQSIYYNAALCLFNLCQYDKALDNLRKAISMDSQNPDYFVLKSKITIRQGAGDNYTSATDAVNQAIALNPNYEPALLQKARLLVAQRRDKDAVALLSNAIANNPTSPECLLLRGFVYKYRLRNVDAAKSDFTKALENDGKELTSLRGFALHELGRDDEARQWAASIVAGSTEATRAESYAMASALYSDIGDRDDALSALETALKAGYGNEFEVKVNEDPYVNLKLVRRNENFQATVNRYASNFAVE